MALESVVTTDSIIQERHRTDIYMNIQFLAFSGCPLADPARENLKTALSSCGVSSYEDIDILDPTSPEDLRGWGSPTILVDGVDVTGHPKGDSVSCRVYNTPGGVPDVQCIIDCLERSQ